MTATTRPSLSLLDPLRLGLRRARAGFGPASAIGVQLLLAAAPHGGQHTARRNAAQGVRRDRIAARDRRAAAAGRDRVTPTRPGTVPAHG